MMDGYWIMFAAGIMLGALFYMCLDLAGSIFKYLKLKRKQLSDGIFVHNANKTKGGKCPACGFKAPLSDEEESQSTLICDKCEAGFPGYMYVATKTTKPEGEEIGR